MGYKYREAGSRRKQMKELSSFPSLFFFLSPFFLFHPFFLSPPSFQSLFLPPSPLLLSFFLSFLPSFLSLFLPFYLSWRVGTEAMTSIPCNNIRGKKENGVLLLRWHFSSLLLACPDGLFYVSTQREHLVPQLNIISGSVCEVASTRDYH